MPKKKMLMFDQPGYGKPYTKLFDIVFAATAEDISAKFHECDAVMFTGGADVSPHLYGEPAHHSTSPHLARDKFEVYMWNLAVKNNKAILGICRGAQFACVMSGGRLVQHVEGHTQSHYIEDVFGNSMLMTSAHHQMMVPDAIPTALTIAWTKHPQSKCYRNGHNVDLFLPYAYKEPEIVYFPETRALGIQGHPEYSNSELLHNYCCDVIDFYLLGNQDKKQPYYPPMNPAV